MLYHPDLAAALAQARAAALHDAAAAHVRHDPRGDEKPRAQVVPSGASPIPLDAYPRLCGLPVTIERLAGHDRPEQAQAPGAEPAPVPEQAPAPALSAPDVAGRHIRRPRRRFVRGRRPMLRSAGREAVRDE
jgi:hypothetical protein